MDEYELYPGQHTGEQIDEAVDVVQAAIGKTEITAFLEYDGYIPAVDAGTGAASPFSVAGHDLYSPGTTLDIYGDDTIPTRPFVVKLYKELKRFMLNNVLVAKLSGVSSLPQTFSFVPGMWMPSDLSNYEILSIKLSNDAAWAGALSVEASGRSVTVDGSLAGTTDITVVLTGATT